MSNYHKLLIQEIQKHAQGVPGRKKGPKAIAPAPESVAPKPVSTTARPSNIPERGKPRPAPTGGGQVSSKAIQAMQTAIKKLAQTVSSNIDYNSLKAGLASPPTDPAAKKKFEANYGRDAFSNFIVNRFLRNSKVKGAEYDPDPTIAKMEDKRPSDLKAMWTVLNSLDRIGKEKSESSIDGNWGPRTNNALQNSAAIADSVLKLGTELKMQSNVFDASKIEILFSKIPAKDTDLTPEEKAKRAPEITEILNGVTALFIDFKDQVLQQPYYRNMIDSERPIFTHGTAKAGPADATDEERKIYEDLVKNTHNSRFVRQTGGASDATFQVTIPDNIAQMVTGLKTKTFTINAADLLSAQAFENKINNDPALKQYQSTNELTYKNIVKELLAKIGPQIDSKYNVGKIETKEKFKDPWTGQVG